MAAELAQKFFPVGSIVHLEEFGFGNPELIVGAVLGHCEPGNHGEADGIVGVENLIVENPQIFCVNCGKPGLVAYVVYRNLLNGMTSGFHWYGEQDPRWFGMRVLRVIPPAAGSTLVG